MRFVRGVSFPSRLTLFRHHGVTTKGWNAGFGTDRVDAQKPPIL